ncbi:MAG TPA: hypothetical protein VMU16_04195 [Candidatus Binataceae bacterium]|nr:hypothetical protein [Candidatus Binataceae bacterium]
MPIIHRAEFLDFNQMAAIMGTMGVGIISTGVGLIRKNRGLTIFAMAVAAVGIVGKLLSEVLTMR